MGFLDRVKDQASGLKDKAVDAASKNSDKITGGLDKAG
ncbi:MAG: antitoxin, partial [Propionibacteriales bacterium]|nr:antitoxin [Propionibacteriales bacterium]